MVLGYYKFILFQTVRQSILKFKLRKKCSIGQKCLISKDLVIGKGCILRNNVHIGNNVTLGSNVIIGSNSNINNIVINDNSHIESGVVCTGCGNGKIKIGKESYIGINNILDWSDNITIGDFVHIAGPSTGLWTHSSAKQALAGLLLSNKNINFRSTTPIVIEHNVYIGGNCTIYPGVKIGHHSVVAPNSAVNKNVEPYTMVGGVPAKFIKRIEC